MEAVFNYLCDETAWKVFPNAGFASLEMERQRREGGAAAHVEYIVYLQ